MAGRRLLLSVADGTARAFASRGNDVGGWWALGLLLAETTPADPDFRLDLLTGDTDPPRLTPTLDELGPAWARYFAWTLARHGLAPEIVADATLVVRFDRSRVVRSWIAGSWDRPFTCVVTVRDDRGGVHERSVTGHCARPGDFVDPNPYWCPRQSAGPHDAGRVAARIKPHWPHG